MLWQASNLTLCFRLVLAFMNRSRQSNLEHWCTGCSGFGFRGHRLPLWVRRALLMSHSTGNTSGPRTGWTLLNGDRSPTCRLAPAQPAAFAAWNLPADKEGTVWVTRKQWGTVWPPITLLTRRSSQLFSSPGSRTQHKNTIIAVIWAFGIITIGLWCYPSVSCIAQWTTTSVIYHCLAAGRVRIPRVYTHRASRLMLPLMNLTQSVRQNGYGSLEEFSNHAFKKNMWPMLIG